MKRLWKDESGIGTLEMILILVVILIIALIFKDEITELVDKLFRSVNSKSEEFLE
ncbi:Flp1 family type IVb pilin [Paenibacillus lactis]|nr:Flp1 family type IVb pilin [Paenibacillus lactis]